MFLYAFLPIHAGVNMPIVGPIASICGYGGNYAIFIKNSAKFGIIKSKRVLTNEKIYDIIEQIMVGVCHYALLHKKIRGN